MKDKKHFWLICVMLALVTFGVFSPVIHYDFINYDDPDYVTQNKIVQQGVTWNGIIWAFQTGKASNWHPMTWISHMVDCQIYGVSPAGHHFTNLVFHVANTLLLFLILTAGTGAIWRSALVAALFALHPLHIESVAWISERKDVLSTFFMLLAICAYYHYAQGRDKIVDEERIWKTLLLSRNYFLALLFFALGLMSKPMLVTLPFVLLLLDFWPLQRISFSTFNGRNFFELWLEKIPLFALSIASSIITFLVQKEGGAVSSLANTPISVRVANALVSYVKYIALTFWPTKLAVIYPLRHWSLLETITTGLFLLVISIIILHRAPRRPYLAVGWFWFLGTLVPVIGLVQVGLQSMADRYSYIPLIGLFIVVVWSASEFFADRPKYLLVITAAIALLGCVAVTSWQLRFWQNSLTLFERALAVTERNYIAQNNLGQALGSTGQTEKALPYFIEALRLRSNYPEAENNLAMVLSKSGKIEEAIPHFREAIRLKPNYAEAYYNFGNVFAKQEKFDQAIQCYLEAVRLKPDFVLAHLSLGVELAREGKVNESINHYRVALQNDPKNWKAHFNLANTLLKTGAPDEAISHYQEALRINPQDAQSHNNFASVLQRQGKFQDAIDHFQEAIRLQPDYPEAHYNLALILMQQGKKSEAAAHLSEVLRLQPENEQAHFQLGTLLVGRQQMESAISQFREALRLKPDWPAALNFLARIFATSRDAKFRNGEEAVKLAEHACQLSNNENLAYLDTLGASFAEKGDFAEAIRAVQKAKELAIKSGQKNVADQIELHIQQYQSGKPLREI